jgi:hypothetical protein
MNTFQNIVDPPIGLTFHQGYPEFFQLASFQSGDDEERASVGHAGAVFGGSEGFGFPHHPTRVGRDVLPRLRRPCPRRAHHESRQVGRGGGATAGVF